MYYIIAIHTTAIPLITFIIIDPLNPINCNHKLQNIK